MKVWIGTSGWSYASWRGRFYPEELHRGKWFSHYVKHFNAVEVNATFYRTPNVSTVRGWRKQAPEGFAFAIKVNRSVTHLKKLKDVEGELEGFFEALRPLWDKIEVFLIQLPPSLRKDMGRLEEFAKLLPRDKKFAFEFRHPSWFDEKTALWLAERNFAMVMIDSPKTVWKTREGRWGYVRFHGRGQWYRYNYTEDELKEWADFLKKGNFEEVFVFFNNDYEAYAVGNARAFASMMGKN